MAQKYAATVKNLTLTFRSNFFLVFPIYVERPPLEWRTSKLIVTVTLTVTVTVTGIPLTFWKLIKLQKNIFSYWNCKRIFLEKTLFCDSCYTGGFGLLQRAGYQSKTLSNILFWLDIPFLNRIVCIPPWVGTVQCWSLTLKASALASGCIEGISSSVRTPLGMPKWY